MRERRFQWPVLTALLAAACGGDSAQPLDGGLALELEAHPDTQKLLAADPCWRREKGGWHYSIAHCEPMLEARSMQGVFVTAFEEASFFPGATAIPDANDPARFMYEMEVDDRKLARLSGHAPIMASEGEAYLLTFAGRRTRDGWYDCYGVPTFRIVVDRLTSARYLGSLGPFDGKGMLARHEKLAARRAGRGGEAQARAIERCRSGGAADQGSGSEKAEAGAP